MDPSKLYKDGIQQDYHEPQVDLTYDILKTKLLSLTRLLGRRVIRCLL